MAGITQQEEGLQTFRERFESIRVGLEIVKSRKLVSRVFSAVGNTVAKNLTVDLIRILSLQSQPNILPQNRHRNHLADLFSIGTSINTESFDIKLAIPLIEQVVNNGFEEDINDAVSRLADQASLLLTSPTPPSQVPSDAQFSTSSQVTESGPPERSDEPEFRSPKRTKLVHGDPRRESDGIGIEPKYDIIPSNRNHLGSTLDQPPMFQYKPLNAAQREIRLLVLKPSGDILDLLSYKCSLIHVSMDDNPNYEALSYVWGSGAKEENILIDGRQLSVTVSLAEALRWLYPNKSPRMLWIDAICINQEDIPERSHQVQNMTEIYAKARSVVVWIGLLGTATQNLLNRLEEEGNDDHSPKHLQGWTISGARANADPSGLQKGDEGLLSELAQNPWFNQVWVVQEVAVAQEVIVQTGSTTISWLTFCAALEKCSSNFKMKSIIEAVSTINTIRTARLQNPYYMDLLVLLERFRHCLATDERDKVFALLGLTSKSLAQETVIQVTPDYSKPVFDIYQSLARQYISKRKSLDIICHAATSWVPNWARYEPGLSVLPKRRILDGVHGPMYRCCGDLELDRELLFGMELPGNNRLWLNGFKFDTVSVVGRVATKVQDLGLKIPVNGLTDLLEEWKFLAEICGYNYKPKLGEAFLRTLHADTIGERRYQENTHSAVKAKATDGSALVNDSTGESSSSSVYPNEGNLGTVEKASQLSLEQSNNGMDQKEASIERAAMKRAFFVTEKGYMGLGPSAMEEGDLVYVLSGGQVPFILRPIILVEGFSLVGECYVHGIMDGEAIEPGIEVDTICLV